MQFSGVSKKCVGLTNKRNMTLVCASKKNNIRTIKQLNQLFYDCPKITGEELFALIKGRRMQFSHEEENIVQMIVYPEMWKTNQTTWQGIADVMNVWSVAEQVREKTKTVPDNQTEPIAFDLIIEDLSWMDSPYDY
jgi:hypothetical protein